MPGQLHQERPLARGESNLTLRADHDPPPLIEQHVTEDDVDRTTGPPMQRFDARQELVPLEGLPKVIVGARPEGQHALLRGVAGVEHEHRRPHAMRPQFIEEGEPIAPRLHPVDDDEVEAQRHAMVEGIMAVADDVDVMPGLSQVAGERLGELKLFFNEEYLHQEFLTIPAGGPPTARPNTERRWARYTNNVLVDEPQLDPDDAALPDGDVVTAPVPSGPVITLRFASPYEPWLTLRGKRVLVDDGDDTRAVLLWLSRRLAALTRALDVTRGLRATLTPGSAGQASVVVVTDVIRLEDGSAADHQSLASVLEGARVKLLAFAVLGPAMSKNELLVRVRTLYAAGTPLEVRSEDQERVLGRRRLRVGRA